MGWLNESSMSKPSKTVKSRISREHKPDKIGRGWTVSCTVPLPSSPAQFYEMRIDIDCISRKVKEIALVTAISAPCNVLNARDLSALSGTVVEMSVSIVPMFAD